MRRALPFLIIGVVLAGAVVVTAMLLRNKNSAGGPNNVLPAEKPGPNAGGAESRPQAASAPVVAKPNVKISSPVVLDEYGDYQCPPCGGLYPVLRQIEAEYGNQLRVVFHHFPLPMHKNAIAAARAAEAARLQNKFLQMHDRLYLTQKDWAELDDPRPIFVSYAQELGLKVDQFVSDMNGFQVEQKIASDIQRATSLGVNGTPTVFIDGQQLRSEATSPDGIRGGINVMLLKRAGS